MADAVATVNYQEDNGAESKVISMGVDPKKIVMGTVDLAGDYRTNGVDVSEIVDKFLDMDGIAFFAKGGYMFDYDASSKKVKMYTPAAEHTHAVALDSGTSAAGAAHTHTFTGVPFLKVEESKTVTENACTLSHLPLYIVAVHVTAGDTTGPFNVIPTGETPLTKQVAVNFTTGVMTFLGTDAVTTVLVTYIPKRSAGYLSAVTVDETRTAAAAKVNLAARAGLIQYVWDDTAGKLCGLEPSGEAPSAAEKAVIDINDSGNTSIDSNAADEGHTLKITYVPYTQLPPGTFIDDTDVTLSSQVWNFTGDPAANGYHKTVVPGCGTQLVGEVSGGNNSNASWTGPSGTAANGLAVWNPAYNKITTAQTTAMVTTAISWMILDPDQLTPMGTNANENTHTHGPGTLADAASAAGSATGAAGELADSTAIDISGVPFVAFGR